MTSVEDYIAIHKAMRARVLARIRGIPYPLTTELSCRHTRFMYCEPTVDSRLRYAGSTEKLKERPHGRWYNHYLVSCHEFEVWSDIEKAGGIAPSSLFKSGNALVGDQTAQILTQDDVFSASLDTTSGVLKAERNSKPRQIHARSYRLTFDHGPIKGNRQGKGNNYPWHNSHHQGKGRAYA